MTVQRSVWRLAVPAIAGIVVMGMWLAFVQSAAQGSTRSVVHPSHAILWLVPPQTAQHPVWALTIQAHQDAWDASSRAVEPRLAKLQASHRVNAVQSLDGHVGWVINVINGLPPEIHGWSEIARVTWEDSPMPAQISAWWAQGLPIAPAPGAQQAVSLTIDVGLDNGLISGQTSHPDPIVLTLYENDQATSSGTVLPFPDGTGKYRYATPFSLAYDKNACPRTLSSPAVVKAVQAGHIVSFTLPTLTALADQTTSQVKGQSLPTTTLRIYHYASTGTYQEIVTSTASGEYEANLSAQTTFVPRDYGYIFYGNPDGNQAYVRYNVHWLRLNASGYNVDGVAAPNASITSTLQAPGGDQRTTTTTCTDGDGAFYLYFSMLPQTGDTLIVTASTQIFSMAVPPLTAYPDAELDMLSGDAPPGAELTINLFAGPLNSEYDTDFPSGAPQHTCLAMSAPDGTYNVDLSADGLDAGNYGVVTITDTLGYQAYRRFAVPFLRAHVGSYSLDGQVNVPGTITITLWGRSGVPREMHTRTTSSNGYWTDRGESYGLLAMPGDTISIATPHDGVIDLTVPTMTVQVDMAHSTLSGQAPPNHRLRIDIYRYDESSGYESTPTSTSRLVSTGGETPYDQHYTYWVTSTASGGYMADLNGLLTLQPGDSGTVTCLDEHGFETYIHWLAPGDLTLYIFKGRNRIQGNYRSNTTWDDPQVDITLRDGSGQIKATGTTSVYRYQPFFVELYRTDGKPAIIEAGDRVEASTYNQSVQITVPDLTVHIDPAADAISGHAPPNVPLYVAWDGGDDWDEFPIAWNITSTADGAYHLNLSSEIDLERGDRVDVSYTFPQGHIVQVAGSQARIEATLGSQSVFVSGVLDSDAPITATLYAADGALLETNTAYAKPDRAYFYFQAAIQEGQRIVAQLPDETISLTLPHLTAWADADANSVSGQAPPGAQLYVIAGYYGYWPTAEESATGQGGGGTWVTWSPITATAEGTYRADLGDLLDLGTGAKGSVYYLAPDGHRAHVNWGVPYLSVRLDTGWIRGQAAAPGTVTLTLSSAAGVVKGTGAAQAYAHDGAFYNTLLHDNQNHPVFLSAGDVLSMETGGRTFSVTIPTLTAVFDRDTAILRGGAPADAWLNVYISNSGRRHVQVPATGHYAMDWSDLDLLSNAEGTVNYDNDGNSFTLGFSVPAYQFFLPLINKNR